MSGLFSTFNVATRGMTAQQKAIDVTSHNIANANTEGYTRQRATMETTRPANETTGAGQLGTGVQVSTVSRIRDTYLDYRVRAESGTMGLYEGREKFLTELEGIFNELDGTGISTLTDKVFKSWGDLSLSPEVSNTRTVVAQQSKALTDQLNNTYNQLTKLKENCQGSIKQDIIDINKMLDQINELNQEVISVKVGGNEPNDLMDKRDLLVDSLSSKFGITIDKKTLAGEDLKATDSGDVVNPYLVKSSPNAEVRRFSYVSSIDKKADGTYDVNYYKNGDTTTDANKVTMNMTLTSEQYTSLDEGRVLWADTDGYAIAADGTRIAGTDSTGSIGTTAATMSTIELFQPKTGELQGFMSVQADIDVYIEKLNNVAKGIAFSVNAVHSGETDPNLDLLKFFVNSDVNGKEEEITAGNISINEKIMDDVMLINVGKNSTSGETDGSRALAISQLKNVKLEIQGIVDGTTRSSFLAGKYNADTMAISSSSNGATIGGFFTDIVSTLAIQTQVAKKNVTNYSALLANLEESRTSVSGVSLDEEMANLIQFQHAYQANAKIISTVDELLDLVINGLKK
ncbi:flagellar hook-associated protein FlgK [Clostridium lacusfryxellense]|uniref:flagellar hook-associated protein FlgK n=1 Tax=Clostridium lacusfryxellense TaxID=205328 RepID=UPI001C0E509A|nr:flagellar hook-associated protein FlgK [Clostridium lacusfryxellense]MBU3111759.1 flagellar hook-associated protein FlgK [Clostridium lacusfryxellense]